MPTESTGAGESQAPSPLTCGADGQTNQRADLRPLRGDGKPAVLEEATGVDDRLHILTGGALAPGGARLDALPKLGVALQPAFVGRLPTALKHTCQVRARGRVEVDASRRCHRR